MFYEVIYCITKGREIILNHIPNKIYINVKITMSNMVTHTFYGFPRNLRATW